MKELKTQITEEREKHEQEISERKKTLAELKETLKEIKTQASVDNAYNEREMDAQNKTEKRLQHASLEDLKEDIRTLRTRIDIEKKVHEDNVDFLQRKHAFMQEEALNWMQKHENDTAAKEKEIEILKLNHQRDAVKLKELEKKYKDELANKEKKNFMSFDQDPDELERFNRAASKIQLLWRGYKAQAAQAASKPKGKGKKGKKK